MKERWAVSEVPVDSRLTECDRPTHFAVFENWITNSFAMYKSEVKEGI